MRSRLNIQHPPTSYTVSRARCSASHSSERAETRSFSILLHFWAFQIIWFGALPFNAFSSNWLDFLSALMLCYWGFLEFEGVFTWSVDLYGPHWSCLVILVIFDNLGGLWLIYWSWRPPLGRCFWSIDLDVGHLLAVSLVFLLLWTGVFHALCLRGSLTSVFRSESFTPYLGIPLL